MANESPSTVQSARRKLGRGLGSLISAPVRVEVPGNQAPPAAQAKIVSPPLELAQSPTAFPNAPDPTESAFDDHGVRMLALETIHPNPRQPRQNYDEEAMRALAASIASSGLMQPIVVRTAKPSTHHETVQYQIIAGERRWRAAQIAGLQRIPAVIRNVDDRTAAEFSLIENIQREDLNPMERAEAFQRLIEDFQLTHNEIAERVGLDRSSVTNHLRLNELDEFSKDALRAGRLTLGHGKALLAITNIEARAAMAAQAVREAWSVRELERRVKQPAAAVTNASIAKPPVAASSLHMADLERRLGEHLGTKVNVHAGRTKGSGRLVIEFYSLDQFEGLMRQMQFTSD